MKESKVKLPLAQNYNARISIQKANELYNDQINRRGPYFGGDGYEFQGYSTFSGFREGIDRLNVGFA